MSTHPTQKNLTTRSTTALTTAYGNGSVGWLSNSFDARPFEQFMVDITVTKGNATTLTIKSQVSDVIREGVDADDFSDVMKIDAGAASVEEVAFTLANATEKFSFRVDADAMGKCRFAAKVDVGTGSPVLVMRIQPEFAGKTQSDFEMPA